ncbi:hypothetical protein WJX74_007061 [Apatococcus lobatus]|uniref:Uncharacterized protein n=2 Tax=Apatococcus TaxID=904362 RepID=A0AAW1R018_9CHLO
MALVPNLNVWVLEYLLEQDKIGDAFIRHFYDGCLNDIGELPPPVQVRLMLRVLRDGALNITENTVNSLDSLANLGQHEPAVFAPYSKIRDIMPSREIYTAVKTEAFLKALRTESGSADEQRQQLQRLFANAEAQTMEAERRQQLQEAIDDVSKRQAMFEKHPPQQAANIILIYVKSARNALGPPTLKLVESDFIGGRYNPFSAYLLQTHPYLTQGGGLGSMVGDKRRRTDGAMSSGPLIPGIPGTTSQAGLAGLDAANGRSILWDPQDPLLGTPDLALRNALLDGSGQLSPLQHLASPDGFNSGNRKPGAPRRKIGRWTEEETNALIRLTQEIGKSKWKKILEAGEGIFQNRSQVDLKDKWRNLERQGIVAPAAPRMSDGRSPLALAAPGPSGAQAGPAPGAPGQPGASVMGSSGGEGLQQGPPQAVPQQSHQPMGQHMMQSGLQMDDGGASRLDTHQNGQPDMASPFQTNQQAPNGMDQAMQPGQSDGQPGARRGRGRPRKNPQRLDTPGSSPTGMGGTVTGIPMEHNWAHPHTQQSDPSQMQHPLTQSSIDLMTGLGPVGTGPQGHPGSALDAQLQHHDSHDHGL